jgi:nitric oxide reductase subunit B
VAWYFFIVMALFFFRRCSAGNHGITRRQADSSGWIAKFCLTISRTWHLQLALFSSWRRFWRQEFFSRQSSQEGILGAGDLSFALLGALVVVFGSLIGEAIATRAAAETTRPFFGAQGLGFIDLGRFWQLLLIVG